MRSYLPCQSVIFICAHISCMCMVSATKQKLNKIILFELLYYLIWTCESETATACDKHYGFIHFIVPTVPNIVYGIGLMLTHMHINESSYFDRKWYGILIIRYSDVKRYYSLWTLIHLTICSLNISVKTMQKLSHNPNALIWAEVFDFFFIFFPSSFFLVDLHWIKPIENSIHS